MNTPKKDNGSKKKDESVDGQKGKDDTSYTLVSYQICFLQNGTTSSLPQI